MRAVGFGAGTAAGVDCSGTFFGCYCYGRLCDYAVGGWAVVVDRETGFEIGLPGTQLMGSMVGARAGVVVCGTGVCGAEVL